MGTSRDLAIRELLNSANRLIASSAVTAASGTDEGWSQATILGHLSDVDEQVWKSRIDLMVKASRLKSAPPVFAWWEPDSEETSRKYEHFSQEQAGAKLLSTRSAIVETLTSLDEEDWKATAIHATLGELDIEKCMDLILAHDAEHSTSNA